MNNEIMNDASDIISPPLCKIQESDLSRKQG